MTTDGNSLRVLSLSEPRSGNRPEENEDAFAADPKRGLFAIADGATESSYAASWAHLLVDGFVKNPCAWSAEWCELLHGLRARWAAALEPAPMPWYAEIKWQQGAFATFLGLSIEHQRWRAVAIGDSCLFHIRAQSLRIAFPIEKWDDFCATPDLIGSRQHCPDSWSAQVRLCEGELEPGDRLWLMTDSLSQWFLKCSASGERPWELLESLLVVPEPAATFRDWTTALRADGQLRNDDLTLVAIYRERAIEDAAMKAARQGVGAEILQPHDLDTSANRSADSQPDLPEPPSP